MVAHLMREGTAQATVEMAIVAPVLIVLAIIVYNVMVFTSAVARFDRVAPDIVIAHGVSPAEDGKEDAAEVIAAQLREAMEGYEVEIEVVCEQEEDPSTTILTLIVSPRTYRCTMRYAEGLLYAAENSPLLMRDDGGEISKDRYGRIFMGDKLLAEDLSGQTEGERYTAFGKTLVRIPSLTEYPRATAENIRLKIIFD